MLISSSASFWICGVASVSSLTCAWNVYACDAAFLFPFASRCLRSLCCCPSLLTLPVVLEAAECALAFHPLCSPSGTRALDLRGRI
uniref:Putative secreted protein n=1 Tax=Ixodes ricinus TaxID=34613 RepID=A0A6B0U9H0_IXORI